MPHRYVIKKWIRLKRVIKKLARSHNSSHDLATGVAIGFFVGMLPIMGIQMIVAAAIAAIFRVSKIAAVLPVWVSNPLTFIPLYGFNYWLGHILTGLGRLMKSIELFCIRFLSYPILLAFLMGLLRGQNFLEAWDVMQYTVSV